MSTQAGTNAVVIGWREYDRLISMVTKATEADTHQMLDDIGQQQEDSARRRISETKRAPDGTPWPAWSREYAKTRGPQHSLLRNDGFLHDTMTHVVDGKDAVEVGSPMIYGNRHLFGDVAIGPIRGTGGRIPARPFLDTEPGFADSHDREEIRDIVREWMGDLL